MPEYLAPGVYVEEVSFRSKSIEGVSTSTTGLVGTTRCRPTDTEPVCITSLAEFERACRERMLDPADMQPLHNFRWHAVRCFFEEGGERLYIAENVRASNEAATIEKSCDLLLSHAQRMHYRIAVLESGDGQRVSAVHAKSDADDAALDTPWVRVLEADPIEVSLPPSGFVAGIYARSDMRAVEEAPDVTALGIGFERLLKKVQLEVLGSEGGLRFSSFEGHSFHLWGARTVRADPEWTYVNLSRYFTYLERSIYVGTQWAVFEPNGEALWADVRRTIEDFLRNQWMSGVLSGSTAAEAYFVRCDRSTMTQNDLDDGRLICLIGVAPIHPAEFVIFRISHHLIPITGK